MSDGHQLASLPVAHLGGLHHPAGSVRGVVGAGAVTPGDVPDPDLRSQRQQQSSAPAAAGWLKSRFETCFHQRQDLVLVRTDTLAQVGTLGFDEWILAFAYDGSRRVDFVGSIENIDVST